MARALRLFLAILIAVFGSIAAPRESGRERRLRVAWVVPVPEGAASTDSISPRREGIVLAGDRYWAFVDPETGRLDAYGLRAERFTAYAGGMINQADEVPRWVVQGWDGGAIRIIDHEGVPRFYDRLLVQFGERRLALTTVQTWNTTYLPGDVRLTALAVRSFGEDGTAVATGSVRGELALFRLQEGALIELARRSVDHLTEVPAPIYGAAVVSVSEEDGSKSPALVALRGWKPQYLEFLVPDADGALSVVDRREVPESEAVAEPRRVEPLADSLVAVALRSSVAVWDLVTDRLSVYPIGGVDGVVGGGVGEHATLIAVGRVTGSTVALIEGEIEAPFLWHLDGATPLHADEERVVVEVDGRLVAIEVTL